MTQAKPDKPHDVNEFCPRHMKLPAFDLIGFTKIATSGGEQFEAVFGDSRWQALRMLGDTDPTIYGVGSIDKECPKGKYRYTMAVRTPSGWTNTPVEGEKLFRLYIRESDWIVFRLCFATTFGKLWQADPYKLVQELGWNFNNGVGLHLDVFPPSYAAHDDLFEFWLPVRSLA